MRYNNRAKEANSAINRALKTSKKTKNQYTNYHAKRLS